MCDCLCITKIRNHLMSGVNVSFQATCAIALTSPGASAMIENDLIKLSAWRSGITGSILRAVLQMAVLGRQEMRLKWLVLAVMECVGWYEYSSCNKPMSSYVSSKLTAWLLIIVKSMQTGSITHPTISCRESLLQVMTVIHKCLVPSSPQIRCFRVITCALTLMPSSSVQKGFIYVRLMKDQRGWGGRDDFM